MVLLSQKLSMELIKLRTDLEQKDNILLAMLRKSKFDTVERQMLLKQKRMKKKQVVLQRKNWRAVSESIHERNSL